MSYLINLTQIPRNHKEMIVDNSENYEKVAAEWQYQIAKILKGTLNKHGISGETAKEVCGDFLFNMSMLQDQGKMKSEEIEYRPVICFETQGQTLLYNSADQFDLHDYAFGNTDEAFEE